MTDTTLRLELPLLAAAQAQKHVTHNEALVALDALVHLSVIDQRAAPPSSPAEGDRHLVDTSPSGAWTGQAGRVAVFVDGGWRFLTPRAGWIAWVAADDVPFVHDGSAWTDLKGRAADMFGINTTADTGNRLVVSSPAALFTHEGTDSRIKVNKAAAADTASLLFQTAFSGRAEMGLAGSDAFHVKVSADGTTWREAMVIDPATGYVGIGTTAPGAKLEINNGQGYGTGLTEALRLTNIGTATGDGPAINFYWASHGQLGAQIGLYPQDAASADLLFFTGNGSSPTEKMRIKNNGNVGVGTTTPTCAMDVAGPVRVGQYAKAALPSAVTSGAGTVVYVSDETGGAVLAFSDGADWRRVTDRAVVG